MFSEPCMTTEQWAMQLLSRLWPVLYQSRGDTVYVRVAQAQYRGVTQRITMMCQTQTIILTLIRQSVLGFTSLVWHDQELNSSLPCPERTSNICSQTDHSLLILSLCTSNSSLAMVAISFLVTEKKISKHILDSPCIFQAFAPQSETNLAWSFYS